MLTEGSTTHAGNRDGGTSLSAMKSSCTFRVVDYTPVDFTSEITTGLTTGHAHMVKELAGELAGRSITQFSYAYDEGRGGTYVATESFEGTLGGKAGAFNFVHSATDSEGTRTNEFFLIVPGERHCRARGHHRHRRTGDRRRRHASLRDRLPARLNNDRGR